MAGAEAEQEVGGGAGEGVDGLRGVTDHAEVVPAAEPEVEQPLLERADVLVLVDDEVLVLRADGFRDVRPVLEHADGEQQHVLEVDHAAVAFELLVRGVDAGDLGGVAGDVTAGLGGGGRILLGHGLSDFAPFDLAGDVPQFVAVQADPAARAGLGDELDLALDQPGQLAADGPGPEVLELAQGGGVEGAGLDAAGAQHPQPPAHLARGPRGEGDGEHGRGLEDPGAHPVGDPVGDGPGLAGAGSGEHADRSVQGRGDGALLGVQAVEHRVGGVGDRGEERVVGCRSHPATLPGLADAPEKLSTALFRVTPECAARVTR